VPEGPPHLDRRHVLQLGLAVFGSQLLPGCETLVLPKFPGGQASSPITPNATFYRQTCCGVQNIEPDDWRLVIRVAGEEVAEITTDVLDTFTPREKEHTLQCIGGGPGNQQISNALWGGVPLREILDALGVRIPENTVSQKWTCEDGYHVGVPIEDVDTMWAVWQMNGRPLPNDHGAPLRLLTPGRYGTKNPKWPIELDFVDEIYVGYWERNGWSDDASYLANAFIVSPRDQTTIQQGPVEVRGTAFAGDDPITRVEVTVDGGETWTDATLTYEGPEDVWTLWSFDWTPEAPGDYAVQARVTTVSGDTSSPSAIATNRLYGYDGSMEVSVVVI
jgi:DMSO/TMAO reductase YedYZ molybdopterin-dependent catalytic subunit